MSKPDDIEVVKTDLEIKEEIGAHKKGWAAQRWGIALIFTLVLLAAAGLFGDGIASEASESSAQIRVESERFYRYEARMEVRITVVDPADNKVILSFPNQYLQQFRIESIQPEPKENKHENGRVQYVFEGSGNVRITLYLIPKNFGNITGAVSVNGKEFLLKHLIYP